MPKGRLNGDGVFHLRMMRGLTQTQLVHMAGIPVGLLSAIENARTLPGPAVLAQLLSCLEYSPSHLRQVEGLARQPFTEDRPGCRARLPGSLRAWRRHRRAHRRRQRWVH